MRCALPATKPQGRGIHAPILRQASFWLPTPWWPWGRRSSASPSTRTDADRILRLLVRCDYTRSTPPSVVRRGETEQSELVTTRVRFLPLNEAEIAWYVGSGEPDGKAGAYAIQGLGARFIDWIEGSWSNVVGLPIATVYRMLLGRAVSRLTPVASEHGILRLG